MLEPRLPGAAARMTGRWLHLFGVPPITARALGAFRAVLGIALFLIVVAHPIRVVPVDQQHVYSPLSAAAWVRALAASDAGVSAIQIAAGVSALSFAAGIVPRVAYAVLVGALFLRTLFILLQAGAHDWGTPIVTLLALLVVPWNAAPGLAAGVLRRRRHRAEASDDADPPIRSRAYGFAVWLPGLTLGLAFAAAALEKLRRSGFEWVTDGAVRYHFVEDAHHAPFELGMWIATQPRLAIWLSLGGILVESFFIGVIFVRHWGARAAFGLAAAGLMAGFWVFQGIHWWAWLMLLFAFLPWDRSGVETAASGLKPVNALVVAALVAGQAWASYRRIEIEPLFSNYPMYSNTYNSPEDYEHAHAQLRFRANGGDITDRIRAADGNGILSLALENPAASPTSQEEIRQALSEFRKRYTGLYGEAPDAVEAFLFRRPFDWQAGRFTGEVLEPLGTVQLSP